MFYPPQNVPLKLKETADCPQQLAVFLYKSLRKLFDFSNMFWGEFDIELF